MEKPVFTTSGFLFQYNKKTLLINLSAILL